MSTKDAARGLAVDVVMQWFTRSCGAMKEWEKWREIWEEQLTEQFAQILRTERRKVWEEAAKIAEEFGVHPALNVANGGPEWYRHGKDLGNVFRKKAKEMP